MFWKQIGFELNFFLLPCVSNRNRKAIIFSKKKKTKTFLFFLRVNRLTIPMRHYYPNPLKKKGWEMQEDPNVPFNTSFYSVRPVASTWGDISSVASTWVTNPSFQIGCPPSSLFTACTIFLELRLFSLSLSLSFSCDICLAIHKKDMDQSSEHFFFCHLL